jgi:serine/threonine protein kinase
MKGAIIEPSNSTTKIDDKDNQSDRPAKKKAPSPNKKYLGRLKNPVIIVLTLIWLAITLTGGYFINEAATDNLRNNIIETDFKYLNGSLKSITVIQSLAKNIGALIMLNEEKEIESMINKSDVKHIDGLKSVKVYDMEDNIMFPSASESDFVPEKKWKTVYSAKDLKLDAYSDDEIIIKISSEAHYSDISVGKVIIILSVPLPDRVSTQLQTFYLVWLSVIIILFLLILFITAKFKIETKPKEEKPEGKKEIAEELPCWLEDKIITMFQFAVLELALVKHPFMEGMRTFYSIDMELGEDIQRVGPFKIISQIDSGRRADLYKAKMERDDVCFAIKVLRPNLVRNMEFIKQFRQEARQAELLDHANIVQTVNFREKQNAIVTEYIKGANLDQMMAKMKDVSIARAVFITLEICKGLQYAHSYYTHSDDNNEQSHSSPKIYHHNLKPGNIMLSDQGDVKISDFGISRLSSTQQYVKDGINSGVNYIISLKEELENYYANLTIASRSQLKNIYQEDVKSLGKIFFKMLSGKNKIEMNNDIEFQKKADISDELKQIVSKCLADENQRYKTPFHLLDDLSQLNHSLTVIYDFNNLAYQSPEQIREQGMDHRSDIYSLGVIFYEMLSGKRLWRNNCDAEAIKSINDPINRYCFFRSDPKAQIKEVNELNPDITEELNSIVMKSLRNDKKARYQSVQEMYDKLTDFRETTKINYDSKELGDLVKKHFYSAKNLKNQ